MKLDCPIEIIGSGACTPQRVVPNETFAAYLDTNDEWIRQRTGIRERRFAGPGETTASMAAEACRQAMSEAGVTTDAIDLLITATISPDHPLPSTSCELQARLGLGWIPSFDVAAACSGFVYGLITSAQFLQNGLAKTSLLIGAETLSRVVDMEDRGTCILFGDGAAAAVLRRSQDPSKRLLAARWGADGSRADHIWIPAGGAAEPASARTVNEKLHTMRMKGREVFKFAVSMMQDLVHDTAADAGVSLSDVALLIPHQSNLRIIESATEKLGIPLERVLVNIDRYGNTSAASIPIGLHEARAAGRIKPGDLVMMVAFGAGLTWAAALLRV